MLHSDLLAQFTLPHLDLKKQEQVHKLITLVNYKGCKPISKTIRRRPFGYLQDLDVLSERKGVHYEENKGWGESILVSNSL